MKDSGSVDTMIWIYRRGNGQARVHPSPAHLAAQGRVTYRNLTRSAAEVVFDAATQWKPVPVPAGGDASTSVPAGVVGYLEYDVALDCDEERRDYAEGGSRPAIIVDP